MPASALGPPLHDRLLVRRIEEAVERPKVVRTAAKQKPWKGEVLAVGDGKAPKVGGQRALDVKVGDKVLFGRSSAIEVKVSGEDLLILPEHEFLVVLK